MFEPYNGIEYFGSYVQDILSPPVQPNTLNNRFNITQSWVEFTPSILGLIGYDRDDQRELYNGEFSGSTINTKLQIGGKDDLCHAYYSWENIPEYLYKIQAFSGSDNEYLIYTSSAGIPDALTQDDLIFTTDFDVDYLGVITPPSGSNFTIVGDISYVDANVAFPPFYDLTGSNVWRTASFELRVPDEPLNYRNFNQTFRATASALQEAAPTLEFSMATGSAERSSSGFEVDIYGNITAPTVFTGSIINVNYSESINNSYYPVLTSSLTRIAHVTSSVPYGWLNVGASISGSVSDLQENLELINVYLGYHVSTPLLACNDITQEFRIDSTYLSTATAVYTNTGVPSFTSAGYYSDGSIVRYWNGTRFTSTRNCSSYS